MYLPNIPEYCFIVSCNYMSCCLVLSLLALTKKGSMNPRLEQDSRL